jgi:intracellular septation protein
MTEATPTPKPQNGRLSFALDFGPLILFFIVYNFGGSKTDPSQGSMAGTAAFMIGITIAMVVSKWKLGQISPMMWLSAVLVLGFGSLTLWFRNFGFLQHKATAVYLLFSMILIVGWFRSKPGLKFLLEKAYEGLDEAGWMKLSLNWGLFFAVLAACNELAILLLTEGQYVNFKVFGFTIIIFLFAMANIPMMLKHGLSLGEEPKAPPSE